RRRGRGRGRRGAGGRAGPDGRGRGGRRGRRDGGGGVVRGDPGRGQHVRVHGEAVDEHLAVVGRAGRGRVPHRADLQRGRLGVGTGEAGEQAGVVHPAVHVEGVPLGVVVPG